jgi:hypothetical protein
MTDETIHAFIHRRRRELTHRIAALKGELAPLEQELAQINRMGVANTIAGSALAPDAPAESALENLLGDGTPPGSLYREPVNGMGAMSRFSDMTIKELIIEALRIKQLLTTTELVEFIEEGFGRRVDPNSIRPQLSRLKSDEIIHARFNQWLLTDSAKRKYSMYDHQSSRQAMPELKDEPTSEL